MKITKRKVNKIIKRQNNIITIRSDDKYIELKITNDIVISTSGTPQVYNKKTLVLYAFIIIENNKIIFVDPYDGYEEDE